MNDYKGYSLFNDIEDAALRNRNRAVIMANILEQNTKDKKITPKGASLILGYFSAINPNERAAAQESFKQRATELGYAY